MITLSVNDTSHTLDVEPETPLLYVLRDNLALNGPKFGCGLAPCGREPDMLTQHTTRREFLKGTGALIVGFTLAGPRSALAQAAGAAAKTVALDEVDSFLAVAQDGTVTVFAGKVDLGTGLRTALRQIAAEELEVPFDQVTLIEGDTALTPDQGPTWGSLSIQIGGVQIRQAAATARKALTEMAATKLGVPVGDLAVQDGVLRSTAYPT